MDFGSIELKFRTGVNIQFLILNLNFKIGYKYILKRKWLFLIFLTNFLQSTLWKCGCHGHKERSIFFILDSKHVHLLYIFRKRHKVSRTDLFSHWSFAPKATRGNKKHPTVLIGLKAACHLKKDVQGKLAIDKDSYCKFLELSIPWEKDSIFFIPVGLDNQRHSDHETPKIKFHSVRALERYFDPKNLIHGRETSTISKFSALIFEKYFKKRSVQGCRNGRAKRHRKIYLTCPFCQYKGPVKLMQQLKVAHSFLQSVSNQFHFIILSLPM